MGVPDQSRSPAPSVVDGEQASALEAVAAESSLELKRSRQSRWRRRRPLVRMLQLGGLGLVAGLLALLIWRTIASDRGSHLVGAVAAGKRPPAPGFDLPVLWPHSETWPPALRSALADGRLRLGELRGHPVVINFWASWCVPCKKEARRLAAAAREHAGQVAVLGIDIQDFKSDARRFLRHYRANYVSVRNGDGSVGNRYGITGIPETYFLDSRGRIVVHYIGEIRADDLEAGIRAAAKY